MPKKEIFIVLPYLGIQSKIVTQQLKSCIYKFYGCFNPKIVFRNTRRIKSFFPYTDGLNRSLRSKVVYKVSCWDCDDCYIGKAKRRLNIISGFIKIGTKELKSRSKQAFFFSPKVDDIKFERKVSAFFLPLPVYLSFIGLLSLFFARLLGLKKA